MPTKRGHYKKKGKAHGGNCTKIDKCKINPQTQPPNMLKFTQCGCHIHKILISLGTPDGEDIDENSKESRFLECNSFYPGNPLNGNYYSGVGYDQYTFSECMWTRNGLWFIERQGKLLRPRDAIDTDKVFVDWSRIDMFAHRHFLREKVFSDLRESDLDFHTFQNTYMRGFEPLHLKKKTNTLADECKIYWTNWKDFKTTIMSDGPIVPPRYLKLVSEGSRSNSLAWKDKSGKHPYWESRKKEYEKLAISLGLTKEEKKNLLNKNYVPLTEKQRIWNKHRNCMKCCYEKINLNGVLSAQCTNYQSPDEPGLCYECAFLKMDWQANEEAKEYHRKGWKSGDEDKIFYHSPKPKDNLDAYKHFHPGHFHSVAIACRLIDISMKRIVSDYSNKSIREIWSSLRDKINTQNDKPWDKLATYAPKVVEKKKTEQCVRSQNSKFHDRDEVLFFYKSFIESHVYSMTHNTLKPFSMYDLYVPLFCQEVSFLLPRRKRIRRPEGGMPLIKRNGHFPMTHVYFGTEDSWKLFTWKRPGFTYVDSTDQICLGGTQFSYDGDSGFSSYKYFVAVTNSLFTVFLPDSFDFTLTCSVCHKAKKNDLISFDMKVVYWLHFDDTKGVFDGCTLVGKLCQLNCGPLVFQKCHTLQVPHRIYYIDGKIYDWCKEKYSSDENDNLLMISDHTKNLIKKVHMKTIDVKIPYEITLMILSCDNRYKYDLFDESLKHAEIFENNHKNKWDIKQEWKNKFDALGYDVHKASSQHATSPIPAVQEYYLACAVYQCVLNKEDVFLEKRHLYHYAVFSESNLPYIKVSLSDKKIRLSPVGSLLGSGKCVMQFYPCCRPNKTIDGFSWRRHFIKKFDARHCGNTYEFCNPSNDLFDFWTGSKLVYERSARSFPCTYTERDAFDPFRPFSLVPKVGSSNRNQYFIDILSLCEIPTEAQYIHDEVEVLQSECHQIEENTDLLRLKYAVVPINF